MLDFKTNSNMFYSVTKAWYRNVSDFVCVNRTMSMKEIKLFLIDSKENPFKFYVIFE